ncbi:putative 2-aminoethylphosphonate ABC transporter permease subunit [Fusobacterium varium]|uniref:putative 2-aminoethylphosphonate ABC transporter permease subunit n=1 Tax=Fusobacterium varium TaxID=856 RepID=UPI00242E0A26|nr:putative 2-aminoethylphosphonate ABC transporter permease subunit [Fusobacterium varium]
MKKDKLIKIILSLVLVLFLVISIIFPIFSLFIKAFQGKNGSYIGLKNFTEYFSSPVTASSLTNSLAVSITVTVFTIILAFLFSYGINRSNIRGKSLLKGIALLPLFSPTMTHGIALIYLFGRQGIITKALNLSISIYGFWGIVFAETIFIFPVLFFMLVLAFDSEDYRKYEMAEIMGISKINQFFTITIPNIKYTLITCFFSGFTLSFTDFGAPKVVGGNYNVLATDIFKQVIGQQNFSMGSAVGILLIIPAFLAFIFDIIIKSKSSKIDSKSTKYIIKENKIRDIFFKFFNYILSLVIISFFGIVILASLVKIWPYDMTLSFKSYNFTIMGESIWKIFGNSILVSVFSAILGTILCFLAAYMIEREKKYIIIRKIGYFLSILPNALPGLTIGLAYIFFFNSKDNILNFLYGSFGIIILANIVHFFATPFLTITARLKTLDSEYETISNIMGVSWYRTIFKVIIPLSIDSIIESFSYYFINSMITISAVIFLYTTKTRLISVMMISKNDAGDIAAAAAISVMIILVNIFFKIIFDLSTKYIRNRSYNKKRKDSIKKEKQGENLLLTGKEVLEILNKTSQKTGVKYWLEFGTLLGKIRENNFIGHDINFDIGIMKEELIPKFIIDIENEGFKRISSLSLKNEGLKNIKYEYKGIEIEIFLFDRKDNKVICYLEDKNGIISAYKLSNSTLKETKFMGIDTYIPRNSLKRLLEIYGKNFNISDPDWKEEMSPSRYLSEKTKEI